MPARPASSDDAGRSLPRGERHEAILHAAGRCFVRYGFHRTTMQLVAREAGMSPGNIYRYFPSKNAIVAGMVEADRDEARRRFDRIDRTRPFWEQFRQLGEEYFVGDAHSRAVLCLEIWAEATRNPEIDAINRPFEAEIVDQLAELLENARQRGEIAADVDAVAAAHIILTLTNGLYVSTGLHRDDDSRQTFQWALQAVYGLLSGMPVLRKRADDDTSFPIPSSPQEPSA
ncbi:TetR/AcrR family transcriptional regulator [Pseudochelatococcus contaminans]|uniref:AcrR family transcriptional regulator n=1 Tax=Pseudochelatococcus contaminans TaxID=1538103 RepID=A0A7W6EGH5_9HYPH|nr:TetR/AcrR family transcriptional regulator [Pseudochelatococcus contaminans]MBB3809463.1 AcrR family transcriptional regulator [Pseudochelatococcus contaminans]